LAKVRAGKERGWGVVDAVADGFMAMLTMQRLNHYGAMGEAFFSPVNGMDKGYLNQVEV